MIIYILLLQCDKYYIGKTNKIDNRMYEHFNDFGSAWTKKYKPVEILKVYENCSTFDEDKYTVKMMAKHGINNVRGGSFSNPVLSKEEIHVINKMISNATDKCYNCFSSQHFIKACPYNKYNFIQITELQEKLINSCCNSNFTAFRMNVFKKILMSTDKEIFNNINYQDILNWINVINSTKIKGVDEKIVCEYGHIYNIRCLIVGLCYLIDQNLWLDQSKNN